MLSPARRNLIILLSIFWLLVSWLIVSFRPGIDWIEDLVETLQIFLPGFFLLALILSIELIKAEKHTAVVRKDIFGGSDIFIGKHFLYIPFVFKIVARMPVYPLRFETPITGIDTRTAYLNQIELARLRCDYQITDFKVCLAQSTYAVELLKAIDERHKLKRTDTALWPLLLNSILGQIVDDNLRTVIWEWQLLVDNDPQLKKEPLAKRLPWEVPPPEPETPKPGQVLDNDPYDLSLNREKVAKRLLGVIGKDAKDWGISFAEIVIEHVNVSPDLIKRRTRNKDGELSEAQHQAKLDYIAARARGMAEAEVRAQTVKRLFEALGELRGKDQLPLLTEKMVTEIVRAAMYSDGDTSLNTFLDKPHTPPPGTVKTA